MTLTTGARTLITRTRTLTTRTRTQTTGARTLTLALSRPNNHDKTEPGRFSLVSNDVHFAIDDYFVSDLFLLLVAYLAPLLMT